MMKPSFGEVRQTSEALELLGVGWGGWVGGEGMSVCAYRPRAPSCLKSKRVRQMNG